MTGSSRPDGIQRHHIHDASGSVFTRWPFSLASVGLLLTLALFGVFGANVRLSGSGDRVELTVEGPARIRNGNIYETVLTIESRRDIRDLVVLIDQGIWYEITINSLLPEPSDYGFREDAFELRFGSLASGQRLLVKVDAQVNSGRKPSTNAGRIAIADGDVELVAVDYAMEVLP